MPEEKGVTLNLISLLLTFTILEKKITSNVLPYDKLCNSDVILRLNG